MARTKRKTPDKPVLPDQQTVETLRAKGYTVEREETIIASVKPYAVRDQTGIERMHIRKQIDDREFDAACKILKLWRLTKVTSGIRAQNYAGAIRGCDGDESEQQAVRVIQAKAELHGVFEMLTDGECMAIISVVVFDEPLRDFEHRRHMRHGMGPAVINATLSKIADLWRM